MNTDSHVLKSSAKFLSACRVSKINFLLRTVSIAISGKIVKVQKRLLVSYIHYIFYFCTSTILPEIIKLVFSFDDFIVVTQSSST